MTNANKAVVGALIAALSTFTASIQGRPEAESLGGLDWAVIIISALVAGLVVYATPNLPPRNRPPAP